MVKISSECVECGKPFVSTRRQARHCSQACRLAFTRRRRDRGAELYDFVMAGYDLVVTKLVTAYRAADLAKRAGRPSYQAPDTAAMKVPLNYSDEGDKR